MSFGRPSNNLTSFAASPPERGSFPLDHEGECTKFMTVYLNCMKTAKSKSTDCRESSKAYLGCRMDKVKESYGTYHDIFESLFDKSLASNRSHDVPGSAELIITSYNVVESHYPSLPVLETANAVLISGSAASAYLPLPWITSLIAYVKELPILVPRLRILGICFGHQIIGIAFGGTCEVNQKGWEIGVRRLELSEWGRKIWGGRKLDLHQVHQDHIIVLPEGFSSLASTPISEIHGMIKFFPSSSTSPSSSTASSSPSSTALLDLSQIAILTLQGHPEFHTDMVLKIINNRESSGIISSSVAELSRTLAADTDEGIRVGLLEIICADR